MADSKHASGEPVVIKKYANRRLYNTRSSSYITLDHLERPTVMLAFSFQSANVI